MRNFTLPLLRNLRLPLTEAKATELTLTNVMPSSGSQPIPARLHAAPHARAGAGARASPAPVAACEDFYETNQSMMENVLADADI